MILLVEADQLAGFARFGRKSLFSQDQFGLLKEVRAVCLHDLYVFKGHRGRGYGKVRAHLISSN